jgi:hypothetical protein
MGILAKAKAALVLGDKMDKKWYYNSSSGTITETWVFPGSELQLHLGLGWHGPFDTKDAALKYYNDNKAKNPGWEAPTDSAGRSFANYSGLTDTAEAAKDAATFGLSNAEIQSWLIRIGEILLGIVLVGVGIAKLTGTTNAVAGLVKAKL